MDDVRSKILDEAVEEQEKADLFPILASNEKNLPAKGKKFKLMRELARLNQELRVTRPYSPEKDGHRDDPGVNWSAKQRGKEFVKKGLGTGGGHIPGVDKFGKNPRSTSQNA